MKSFLKSLRGIVVWVLVMVSLFLFVLPEIFTLGVIPSGSMIPTLEIGDKVFCTHVRWNILERGDIIVFHPNKEQGEDQFVVKRLIGLGGDHIRIEKGIVSVNGVEIQEPYIGSRLDYTGSFVVPKGKYFVLGDNRADSLDARFWENPFIDESQVKYKALFRVYPFNKMKIFKKVEYDLSNSNSYTTIEDTRSEERRVGKECGS